MYEVEHLVNINNSLGEGPLWNVKEQKLYWIDILEKKFFTYDPHINQHKTFTLNGTPGCLAFHESGKLLFATEKGFAIWDGDRFSHLRDNTAYQPANRFNDGAVDRRGRFWAGTSSDDPVNSLYRLDNDGDVTIMERDIYISNGIGWSPDNKTMYYSDSGGGGHVFAYDFDLDSGTIENRRVFIKPGGTDAVADGLTVDSEGCLWIAFWDGWKVARYDPDGQLIAEIRMPVQRPTSCNFGGTNLDELYVTSAAVGMDLTEQPQAGDLFRIAAGVKGLPEPDGQLDLSSIKLD